VSFIAPERAGKHATSTDLILLIVGVPAHQVVNDDLVAQAVAEKHAAHGEDGFRFVAPTSVEVKAEHLRRMRQLCLP
jgi:hypothetical protein